MARRHKGANSGSSRYGSQDAYDSRYEYEDDIWDQSADDYSRYNRQAYGMDGSSTYSRLSTGMSEYAVRRRKRRNRRIITGVLIVIVGVLVAGVAGAWAFLNSINNSLHAGLGEDFASVLSQPVSSSDPYYVLLMGTDGREGEDYYRSDTIILARVDPTAKQVTLVSIPRDTRVELGDHGYGKINAAHAYGGAKYAVEVVEEFAGVEVSHYVEINFEGFVSAVDAIGGVEVDVPYRIDDEDTGPIVIEAGLQTLNGEEALEFCRCRAFPDGDYQRQKDQQIFLRAFASKLMASDARTLASAVTSMAGYVTTDMNVDQIVSMANSMRGMDTDAGIITVSSDTWSDSETISGVSYVIADMTKFNEIMAIVDAGGDPNDTSATSDASTASTASTASDASTASTASSVVPGDYYITVRNGSGITGCAIQAADKLTPAGYGIESTGNADSFVYDETLVVYDSEDELAVAEDIVSRLGVGRVVESAGRYSFSGDLLVVVGKDWPA